MSTDKKLKANGTGKLLLGDNVVVDQNTDRLGVGTASPGQLLDIYNTATSTYTTSNALGTGPRFLTQNNSLVNNQASEINLAVSGNNGSQVSLVLLSCVQPTIGDRASDFSIKNRKTDGTFGETVRVTSTGAVTLGPISNYDGINHTLYGSIIVATAPSNTFNSTIYKSIGNSGCQILLSDGTASNDELYLFGGGYYDGTNHYAQETNTNPTRIALLGTAASGNSAFVLSRMRNGAVDYTSTAQTTALNTALNLAICTSAGAWSNISGGSWGTISDARLKKNIQSLESGLDKILALRPVTYEWRDEAVSPLRPTTNFIAQEVELIDPSWVVETGQETITEGGEQVTFDNVKQVHFDSSFTATLVKAIQELAAKVEALEAAAP